jgi:hypothetical protein
MTLMSNRVIFGKVVHKLAVDSALFLLKFRATIRLLYNNQHIELSYRRTEFKQKYRCIYRGSMNHLLFFLLHGSKRGNLRIATAA